MDKAGFGQGHQ